MFLGADGIGEADREWFEQRCDAREFRTIKGEGCVRRECGREWTDGVERTSKCNKVAWSGAAKRGTASDAGDILHRSKVADCGTCEALITDECSDAGKSGVNRSFLREGVAEPVAHETAAHRRCRRVENREQASFARDTSRRREVRNAPIRSVGCLCLKCVAQNGTRRADRRIVANESVALERLNGELRSQCVESILRAELPARACGQHESARRKFRKFWMHAAVALLCVDEFARRDPREFVGK